MRLDWKEVRINAKNFSEAWRDARYEKGETQSFYNAFFNIFGIERRSVARYEERVNKIPGGQSGYIDLFWPGTLLVEQKSAGRSLAAAREQAGEYFDALEEGKKPRYILLSDFQNFELLDLDSGEESRFPLADLPQHVERFGFIMGVFPRSFKDQDPVNIAIAEKMGHLHDLLEDSGYRGKDLEHLLVRLIFCLFADNTGTFMRDSFLNFVADRSKSSDFSAALMRLFEILNTPEEKRDSNLPEDLAKFPYVNGGLFRAPLSRTPSFTNAMVKELQNIAEHDWSKISPAIFGALFQSVMDKKHRRQIGAHYTTEQNILKALGPLFLDDLRAEFEAIKKRKRGRPEALEHFRKKLSELIFFDPACGCGNFLVIAYRELRRLEIEIVEVLKDDNQIPLLEKLSVLDINQFYGLEIEEFPARIAETAMWMMDALMNRELGLAAHINYERLPLRESAYIRTTDALEIDWNDFLPADKCAYLFGNPPFVGYSLRTNRQKKQIDALAKKHGSGRALDYVSAWFLKAGEYAKDNDEIKIALVATNSITQGEQVGQLWPILHDTHKLEITFAHRTFAWGSEVKGRANVHVVIIGLMRQTKAPPQRRLFFYETAKSEPEEISCSAITPYLTDGSNLLSPHLVVKKTSHSLSGFPEMRKGTQPTDGNHYVFTEEEKDEFLKQEPKAKSLFRPYMGAEEFLNGKIRYILYLAEAEPGQLSGLPKVRERIAAVRKERKKSKKKPTIKLAEFPQRYDISVVPKKPFLFVPSVSSERREYAPIGWLEPPTIPSNLGYAIEKATKSLFALLTSAMHMAWLRAIGGRLKSDYRYTPGLVYNTFPLPPTIDKFESDKAQEKLAHLQPLADAVIQARAAHPNSTLAELYTPDLMPSDLRKAHQALDKAVDKLYRRKPFSGEADRLAHLLKLYEHYQGKPLLPQEKAKRSRHRPLKR